MLSKRQLFIGLDPGVKGAAACIDVEGRAVEVLRFSKCTDCDVWEWLGKICLDDEVRSLYLEDVSSSPQMGVVSAFTFGKGLGRLEAWSIAAGAIHAFPIHKVRPLKWQTLLRCKSGGNKNVTKSRAQKLFPALTITHEIADALLIAEYARQVTVGAIRK